MSLASSNSVGRTLARLAALAPRRVTGTERSPQQTRDQIRMLVTGATEPVGVEELSAATGLHANTVRAHLDVLVATGEVERRRGPARGRGRPPWLYSATDQADELVEDLREVLQNQLGLGETSAHNEAFIRDAAQRWADVVAPAGDPAAATTPAAAVELAAAALTEVGFDAEQSPLGDTVALRACPYAPLINDHPIICDIHTALLQELLDRTGQGVRVREMEVWPTPTACLARLDRPDLAPRRVITPTEDGVGAEADEPATNPPSARTTTRRKAQ